MTVIQIRHGSITGWQSHLLTWFLHTLVSWMSWQAVWCVTLRDISPPPLMEEWKGYDNALMEYGHNKTNNMCCYIMIRGFLLCIKQFFDWLKKSNFNIYKKFAEVDCETSSVLLFLGDRKLRRFYLFITSDLLLIQKRKSRGHYCYIVTCYF